MSLRKQAVHCECGDHCFINLTKGYVTIFDPNDVHLTLTGSFQAGVRGRNVYALHTRHDPDGKLRTVLFHREIMDLQDGLEVDHRRGDGLDNRRRKLRAATSRQNQLNKRSKGKTSKYRGVCWDKNVSKWRVRIKVDSLNKCVGSFIAEEAAAKAYDAQARIVHGEFARLNFPDQ